MGFAGRWVESARTYTGSPARGRALSRRPLPPADHDHVALGQGLPLWTVGVVTVASASSLEKGHLRECQKAGLVILPLAWVSRC